jgi:hypothetical protein
MSKISKLIEALQSLEKAEKDILEARRALHRSHEFYIITDRANRISEAAYYFGELLRRSEAEILNQNAPRKPQDARKSESPRDTSP